LQRNTEVSGQLAPKSPAETCEACFTYFVGRRDGVDLMALISVSGLRGGVGVTSIAANLAMMVASSGQSAVLLDLSQASMRGLHFGLDPNQPAPGFDAPAAATGPVHGGRLLNSAAQAAIGDLGDGLSSGDSASPVKLFTSPTFRAEMATPRRGKASGPSSANAS